MTNLHELAQAIEALEEPVHDSILIYGASTVGKTALAATIAKVPWVENVYWFDLENGRETIITMYREGKLTKEEAEKIKIFKIPDTPDAPVAYETMLKTLTQPLLEHPICEAHGRVSCPACKKIKDAKMQGTFSLSKTTGRDFVVMDSGSQLADSIMSYLCKSKPFGYKPGWDEYGPQGRELSNALSVIQAAKYCNFIVITQNLIAEYDDLGGVATAETVIKREKVWPLIGTKAFSSKCGKYFAHKFYLSIENKKHKAGSATTYKMDVLSGSRSNWKIEDIKELSMEKLYEHIKGDHLQHEETENSTT